MAAPEKILQVNNLHVGFKTPAGIAQAVNGVNFDLFKGETLAIVGESGCGKSVTATAIMQILPKPAAFVSKGEILLEGKDILKMTGPQKRKVRGNRIAMIFQEPQSSLNPVFTISNQLCEMIMIHRKISRKKAIERCLELLNLVGIPEAEQRMKQYPHELSGGMKQRIMIAMALACDPEIIIADEPTTALDVTIQAQVLNLINDLREKIDAAVLLITHDLGVVRQVADRVGVMYMGRIVESAPTDELFKEPRHPYTLKLLQSLPSKMQRGAELAVIPGTVPSATELPVGCPFANRCYAVQEKCKRELPLNENISETHSVCCHFYDSAAVADSKNKNAKKEEVNSFLAGQAPRSLATDKLKVYYPIKKGIFKRTVGYVKAVDGLTIEVPPGKTVALVGESGCGKTTFGKALVGLEEPMSGSIKFGDEEISRLTGTARKQLTSEVQIIFQDPFSSLDPRMTVKEIVAEGMRTHQVVPKGKIDAVISELFNKVGLKADMMLRYPHEFSGGQRQRICIARALAVQPELIVCDEATSALDVSVQAQILNLLKKLQREMGLSYLFITHDLSVVEYFSDYIYIMYLGEIVEFGPVEKIFATPKHPYTKALLSAVPRIDETTGLSKIKLEGDVPSPINPPKGCRFHTRCPEVMPECSATSPMQKEFDEINVRCHLYND